MHAVHPGHTAQTTQEAAAQLGASVCDAQANVRAAGTGHFCQLGVALTGLQQCRLLYS